jgi:hypothetical protein
MVRRWRLIGYFPIRCGGARSTDERVQQSTEVLDAIDTIKLHAWEAEMQRRLLASRGAELRVWRKLMLLNWAMASLSVSVPLLLGPLTLAVYCYQRPPGEPMKLSTTFTALSFLTALQGCLQNVKNVYNSMVTTQVRARVG